MNREIKFRAWDKRQKQMSYPFTLVELTQYEHIFERKFPGFLAKFNDLIWMEYTGLHDKNGKEIYEGDILRYTHKDLGHPVDYIVIFFEGAFVQDRPKDKRYTPDFWCDWDSLEVIGNIYENPELLK